MLSFKRSKELHGDRPVVEVWNGDVMVATIYPHENSISVVSKYFKEAEIDREHPPKVTVKFNIGK